MDNIMIILDLVKKYISYDNIINDGDNVIVVFNNKRSIISITNDSNWINVKNYIDTCIKNDKKDHSIKCNKCVKGITINRYIDIIRSNDGLYICPFCDYTFGHFMNKYELDNLEYMVHLKKQFIENAIASN